VAASDRTQGLAAAYAIDDLPLTAATDIGFRTIDSRRGQQDFVG